MHHFDYRNGALHCEDVPLSEIADAVGTPVYVYSSATLVRHARVIAAAFAGQRSLIAYSVKANGNLAVLATLAREGCGADVVSLGELRRALAAAIAPQRIVFSGVGKSRAELQAALGHCIHQFNVESEDELRLLSDVASAVGTRAPVALRVNPDVAAGAHPNISTGKAGDKFGIAWTDAREAYALAARLPGIEIVGIDVHIGSQIDRLEPMRDAFRRTVDLARQLRVDGHGIRRIDFGGGLAIPYAPGDDPPSPAAYAQMVAETVGDLDIEVIVEPGRVIVGNAGVLVTEALYLKASPARTFLVVDAGMNDLIRPALYGAFHAIRPLAEPADDARAIAYDVVGPICESTDKFATGRVLPAMRPGERLAIMSAGAYGASLSSQYNARPLVPEVLVKGDRFDIVRRRPTFEEMTQLEGLPDWLT